MPPRPIVADVELGVCRKMSLNFVTKKFEGHSLEEEERQMSIRRAEKVSIESVYISCYKELKLKLFL